MFEWIKKLYGFEVRVEVWHYECVNGHKWKSYQSPRGTYVYGIKGQTKCSICKSSICRGEIYIDGKKTMIGASHIDFDLKKQEAKND